MQQDVTTWIVTADGRQALVHEERVRHGALHPVADQTLRAEDHDRPSEHAHRATVHSRHGTGRHGAGDSDPADAMEEHFLGRVADMLEVAAKAHRFEKLILMAPPRALGILRGALGPDSARRIELSDPHDRVDLSDKELRDRLRAVRAPN